jgi:tetratricopeptide (TPR) repeat protein
MKTKERMVPAIILSFALFSALLTGCGASLESLLQEGKYHEAEVFCEKQQEAAQKDCYLKLADAYFSNENYDSAAKYYQKSGHKEGFRKIAEMYFAKNNYDMAFKYYLEAEKKIVFEENFDNNRNNWFEKKDEEVYNHIQDGKYIFEHKRTVGSWFTWPQTPIPLEQERDFTIESTVTKIDGVEDNAYEIVWGFKDVDNCYKFGVDSKGYYLYSKFENGKWGAIIDWAKSHHLNQGNSTNTLSVEKSGAELKFYINGHFVNEAPYEGFFGEKIGFALNNTMKVEIDNLVVTQLPSEKEIFVKIAQKCVHQKNYNSAVELYEKAGFTTKEAYIKIAEASFANGDHDTTAKYFEMVGWTIQDLKSHPVFEEQFIDNRNDWAEEENEKVFNNVQNGKYMFAHKRKQGSWFSWNSIDIEPSGDFMLESTITKRGGIEDNAYEIVWGLKDIDNCYKFGVSGDGGYIYSKFQYGKWQAIIDWTDSPYVNQGNSTNTLAIVKSGDLLKFYINDHFVNTTPYQKFFGNNIGFALNKNISIEVDDLIVTQLPPEIVLMLAAMSYEKSDDKDGFKTVADAYLERKDYDSAFRYYEKLGDQEKVVAIYINAVKTKTISMPVFVKALGKFGNDILRSSLQQFLDDEDEEIRNAARLTLKSLDVEE